MTDTTFAYPSGAASLFATAARKAESIIIWTYCDNPNCWTQTNQMFIEDDGTYEIYYACIVCGNKRKVAVR